MKLLFLGMLVSFNLFAGNSHVGEWANYNFSQENMDGTYSIEVRSFSEGKYTIEGTTQVNGQRQISFDTLKQDDLITHAKMTQLLKYCGQIGGVSEIIEVGESSFNTCRLTGSQANSLGLIKEKLDFEAVVWAGDVPIMGVVKMVNGNFVMTIQDYLWN